MSDLSPAGSARRRSSVAAVVVGGVECARRGEMIAARQGSDAGHVDGGADNAGVPGHRNVAGTPVLGTWTATTTCSAQYKALMSRPGLRKHALEMVAGNGFIPGVRSPNQLKDRAHPCRGAVPRKHSHVFTKDGRFGSLDWNGQDVDDGTYTLKGANKIVIAKEFPSVTFTYKLQGKTIEFVPQIPKGCSTFRCAWSVSMAIPGKAWTRTAR